MSSPPDVPAEEARRQAAAARLASALGDTRSLDRLTSFAARLLEAPYAQISLTGEEQVVVSRHGATPEPRTGPAGDSLCTVTVRSGEPLVLDDTRLDGRVSALPPVAEGGVRAYLGVPLHDATGAAVGAICVYDDAVHAWDAVHVELLAELAASAVAELELRALGLEAERTAARLDLALDASGTGSFDLDADTGQLLWDDRLMRLFGYDRATFVEHLDSFTARLHPEDVALATTAIEQALTTRGGLSLLYRIVREGGEVRWVEARGRVLPGGGATGGDRLLGVAYDVTELREARDRVVRVLETMNDAFYALDDEWRFTYVNRQAERLLRRPREELLGKSIWDEFPAALGSTFQDHYELAVTSGRPVVFEAPFDPLGGWYELSAWPGPDGLSVYFQEITDRHQVQAARDRADAERKQAVLERERAYAEAAAANTRLALLADASPRLSASLEPRQVLERLSELVLPSLGSWVVVALTAETTSLLRGRDVAGGQERVHVVHVAHAVPTQREPLARLVESLPLSTADHVGVGAVIRSGRPEWLPAIERGALETLGGDDAQRAELRAADPGSALTVPLTNRGRVLGAMTVGAPADAVLDRTLLADLAARAAVALDNALLYGAERRNGLTLQRSLLPQQLPEVEGLLTAARYLPGTTGAFVGGDWYQGVRVGDALLLAMGDVLGHGMRSAARMGQLRAIVATLALEGHGPSALLRRLAQSVDVLLDLELATLLVALYDPAQRTLTVASAGHPPPLLAPLGGPPAYVDVEPGPPLGTAPHPYEEVVVPLGAGATVVLYTDGLIENRQESLDVGLERLRAALEEVRLPPDAVCDHVLERLGRSGGGDDDVALLVLSHLPGPGS